MDEVKRYTSARPDDVGLLAVVTDLLSDARDDQASAAVAVAALRAATVAIRGRHLAGLPESERLVWEHLGARFDPSVVPAVEAASAAAFADLVARSVVGDAAVAELLGVDRSRISQRISERSLYAFTGPSEERCFPRWQFVGTKTVPGLKAVLAALDAELHPLTIDHWFTTPNVDLEVEGQPVTPTIWLATGGSPNVAAELARDL